MKIPEFYLCKSFIYEWKSYDLGINDFWEFQKKTIRATFLKCGTP